MVTTVIIAQGVTFGSRIALVLDMHPVINQPIMKTYHLHPFEVSIVPTNLTSCH